MARRDDLWISFKGISSASMLLKTLAIPDRIGAADRGSSAEVLGRDGDLWVSGHSKKPVIMPVPMRMKKGASRTEIMRWLSGSGRLIFSDDPDYFYRARVNGEVTFPRFALDGNIYDGVDVEFSCQPYKYSLAGAEPLPDITDSTFIENPGNVPAHPLVTVYGTGDINLMIGGNTLLLSDVDGYITVDLDAKMAFKDGENQSLKVTVVNDDDLWPELVPGMNAISWSGAADKIVMIPYWRWN